MVLTKRSFILSVLAATFTSVQCLWPIPRSLNTGTGLLKLSPSFVIEIDVSNPPNDLINAVNESESLIKTDKLQRLVVGRGSSDAEGLETAKTLSSLTIKLNSGHSARPIAEEAVQPIGTRSEAYSLSMPSDGSGAVLSANSTLGLYRGLTTFSQLWYYFGGITYTNLAPLSIVNDSPAFVSLSNCPLASLTGSSHTVVLCWIQQEHCQLSPSFQHKSKAVFQLPCG